MSNKPKKVKRSFADQLLDFFTSERKKRNDAARRLNNNPAPVASSIPTQPQTMRTNSIQVGSSTKINQGSVSGITPQQTPIAANPGQESPAEATGIGQMQAPQGSKRIIWESTSVEAKSGISISAASTRKIDWGTDGSSVGSIPGSLIGLEDAFDHSLLMPGERVAFCTIDKVAYHEETWEFLRKQTGRCCICGQSQGIRIITLPGNFVQPPSFAGQTENNVPVRLGEKVIGLQDIPNYLYQAVLVQDFVYDVYCTRNTGTYFVRFEERGYYDPVFSGFKIVIFPDYISGWTANGLRIEDYKHQYIRVRGVVQEHPTWGTEILVNSPRVIELVTGPKSN